jgi:prepilin-type processing-associated H-X9-DG protein
MGWTLGFGDYLAQRQKLSEILIPGPSGVFVFIDEHEQSIYDGEFHTSQANDYDALRRDGGNAGGIADLWLKLPADRHNQGANLSFADGHVDPHHWKASKRFQSYSQLAVPSGDLQDLRYVQSVLPRLR